ncbi:MAG: hypothetical protein ACAH88_13480, partial [Roseimicrobium sp.]
PGSNFETYCTVHRGSGQILASSLIGVDIATDSVPLSPSALNVPSVRMKGLTVIGNDPYDAVLPVLRAEPVDESGEVVPRAVPVVEEDNQPKSPIKLAPPPPLKLD